MDLEQVLTLADQALYQAKLEGRNTVRLRLPQDRRPDHEPRPVRS